MPNSFDAVSEHRYPIEDFNGGIVTDVTLKKQNEVLDALNVIINTNGGFKKRKGVELLTKTGTPIFTPEGINSESNIWAYVFYIQRPDEGVRVEGYYIAEGNLETINEKDIIVYIPLEGNDCAAKSSFYSGWYTSWIDKGTAEGWISNYTYGSVTPGTMCVD